MSTPSPPGAPTSSPVGVPKVERLCASHRFVVPVTGSADHMPSPEAVSEPDPAAPAGPGIAIAAAAVVRLVAGDRVG